MPSATDPLVTGPSPSLAPDPAAGPIISNLSRRGDGRGHALVFAIAFAVIAASFAAAPVSNQIRGKSTKDYALWFTTGQRALHGGDIYTRDRDGHLEFMYPPSAAALLALPSALGKLPLLLLLILITSAAWLISILLSVHLTTGCLREAHPLLFYLPSACCIASIYDTYLLGQPALALLACMLGAFFCLRRRIDWAAGALIAIATAIKAFPILAVPYLIYRRRWRAAAAFAAFLTFFLLLPIAFRGFSRAAQDMRTWSNAMVFRYDSSAIGQRPGRGFNWKNNSLQGVANRLLRALPADHVGPKRIYVNVADLPFATVNRIIVATALLLSLAYVLLTYWRGSTTLGAQALEQAMLIPLILIFAPLSFNYNWAWLIFPIALIVHFILHPRTSPRDRNIASLWLIACLLLLALAFPVPLFRIPRAMGNTFWSTLLLFAELGWILHRPHGSLSDLTPAYPSTADETAHTPRTG